MEDWEPKTKLDRVLQAQRERNERRADGRGWNRGGVLGIVVMSCGAETCPATRIMIDVDEEATAVEVTRPLPHAPMLGTAERVTTAVNPMPLCPLCQKPLHFVALQARG